jgi:hypothetical protein
MKIGTALGGAVILGGIAWLAVEMYGDGETKQARDDAVEGAKDAADDVEKHVNPDTAIDGANKAADTVAGLSPNAWKLITIGIAVLAVAWIWKDPKRRALAFGLLALALAVLVVTQAA